MTIESSMFILAGIIFLAAALPLSVFGLRSRAQKNRRIKRAVGTVLFLVMVPKETLRPEEQAKPVQEMIASAEQFVASLYSIYQKGRFFSGQEHVTFEIVADRGTISFYVAAPFEFKDLVEKQINSYFPSASIEEVEEHNIFREDGANAAAQIVISRNYIFPFKTYKTLEADPLNALTNGLSKLGEEASGAIQIMIRPRTSGWQTKVKASVRAIQEGRLGAVGASGFRRVLIEAGRLLGDIFRGFFAKPGQAAPKPEFKPTPIQEEIMKALTEKASQVGFETIIRVVTSAPNKTAAEVNLSSMTAAFQQFATPHLNSFMVI